MLNVPGFQQAATAIVQQVVVAAGSVATSQQVELEQCLMLAWEKLVCGRGVDLSGSGSGSRVDRATKRIFRENFAEFQQTIRSAVRL